MKRTNEYDALNVLVGAWQTKGSTIATDDEPSQVVQGTDEYQWLPGEFFLRHDAHMTFGSDTVDVLELIGTYDKLTNSFPMRAFDNLGNFEEMRASVDEDSIWAFTGDTVRATLIPEYDGKSMSAHWERLVGDTWQPWMDLKLTRLS